VRLLGARLLDRGVNVVIIAPLVPRGRQAREDCVDGVRVIRIPYPRVRLLGGFVLLARLVGFIVGNRNRIAAIHAHILGGMAAVSCLVGRALGKTVVVKAAGAHEKKLGVLNPGVRRPFAAVLRWALSKATYYQAISQDLARSMSTAGFDGARIRLIPNAVDTERFQPSEDRENRRQALGVSADLVGVFVGRLEPEKGLEALVRAWAEVFDPAERVTLFVLGSGSLGDRLRSLVTQLGRQGQIRMVGPTPAVENYLGAADFAVLPSVAEGLSNSLLEYMASGLPVLGSKVSGTEDLVAPGRNGWLFQGHGAELADCLRNVRATTSEARKRMGQAARRDVVSYAGIDVVLNSLVALYGVSLQGASAKVSPS